MITKFVLVMYMCSMVTGQCPNNFIPGFSFDTHTQCTEYGYRVAHGTFKNLEEREEMSLDYIEKNKIVVKFECRPVKVPEEKLVIPPPKPKVGI